MMQREGACQALPLAAAVGKAHAAAASPIGVASAYGYSQPSSATSSLAATLADLQVGSRQSSAGDLGDRSRILAGLPPGLAAVHTRCPSTSGDDASAPGSAREHEQPCSPQTSAAIRSFDSLVLRTLSPVKTRNPCGSGRATSADELPPSPPAPCADRLVSPFQGGLPGLRLKQAMARPMTLHAHSSSGMIAPGAYAPYDVHAAALAREGASLLPHWGPAAAACAAGVLLMLLGGLGSSGAGRRQREHMALK